MSRFRFDYPRYLSSKKEVDDRALNDDVRRCFLNHLLKGRPSTVRLLEVGGGTGRTLCRLLSRLEKKPIQAMEYVLVDEHSENLTTAQKTFVEWAQTSGYRVDKRKARSYELHDGPIKARVHFQKQDLLLYARDAPETAFDAVIAQSVLDLVNIEEALQHLNSCLRERGLWYLPLHFDGRTVFEPSIDPGLDEEIERLYHESMDNPCAGRRLLTELRKSGSQLLAVGPSDWIVFGDESTGYTGDEAYFLTCILHFIESEVSITSPIDSSEFSTWMSRRKKQIGEGRLIYIAHQIDICAQKRG